MEEAVKYQDNPDWRVDLAQMRRSRRPAAARATLQETLQAYPGQPRAAQLLAQIERR